MDSQQLYCQTHVSSQAADPDTGQHKDKLKVLFLYYYFLSGVRLSPLGTAATTGLKLMVGHVHYVSYPLAPFSLAFFFQWLYSPILGPGLFFSFMIILQTVGLLGRVISSSQGL
jgi:hypothetical protein